MNGLDAHSSGILLGINKRRNSRERVLRRVMNGVRGRAADYTLTSSSNVHRGLWRSMVATDVSFQRQHSLKCAHWLSAYSQVIWICILLYSKHDMSSAYIKNVRPLKTPQKCMLGNVSMGNQTINYEMSSSLENSYAATVLKGRVTPASPWGIDAFAAPGRSPSSREIQRFPTVKTN